MEDAQSCSKSTDIQQSVHIGCPSAEEIEVCPESIIAQHAIATILSNCYQSADKQATLKNKIKEDLIATAEAKGAHGLALGIENSTSDIDTDTRLQNILDMATRQPCDATIGIGQSINICARKIKLCGSITQEAQASITGDCTQISRMIADLGNDLDKHVESTATAGENWADILIIVVIALVVLAIIGGIFMYMNNKKEEDDSDEESSESDRPNPHMRRRRSARQMRPGFQGRGETTGEFHSSAPISVGTTGISNKFNLSYDW